ncbi:hypothetical protein FI667_g752, partial [Globisporangium splendens]
MAFFGLTGLGSQSPFDVAKETPLHEFDAVDFQNAFMQTYQPGFTLHSESEEEAENAQRTLQSATLSCDQLPAMLQYLYQCLKRVNNVPLSTQTLVRDGFAEFQDQRIALPAFLKQMEMLKTRAQELEQRKNQVTYLKDGLQSREFISNNELRAHLVKYTRMARDPKDKALVAMTDAHTLGWSPPTIVAVREPTKSCEETKYASAMVKAGVYTIEFLCCE